MRHRKKHNHLSRTKEHRKALLMNLSNSLIRHKRIQTTLAKAKALRTFVEPLLTKAKQDTTGSRRTLFKYLQDKESIKILFKEINPKILKRPGGYTRIIRLHNRLGDNATIALIELVDFNEDYHPKKEVVAADKTDVAEAPAKKTRRKRSKKSTKPTTDAAPVAVDADTAEVKKVDTDPVKQEEPKKTKAEKKSDKSAEIKKESADENKDSTGDEKNKGKEKE